MLSHTTLLSTVTPGIGRGSEPVAMTTCFAAIVSGAPSPAISIW